MAAFIDVLAAVAGHFASALVLRSVQFAFGKMTGKTATTLTRFAADRMVR
jgi:hypothetical protein